MARNVSNTFRERARHEAARYGNDPWVFVRELVQNARDAGAHNVEFIVARDGGRERIVCRDDGEGMSFEHARRYLFSLYSSSKGGRSRAAGRFGIGFWSVLRFDPDTIVIRSRGHRREAWQVVLDGQLKLVSREPADIARGTEIVLERQSSCEDIEQSVTEAVFRDAPFVRCRHRTPHPLTIRVNGRLARREPALPPPSLSFSRRGLRGVVGLGPVPGAEVFAHGLRIRDAPSLDDLLVEGGRNRPAIGTSVEGLAPRAILDSSGVDVLLARGDAREDRALTRLVAVGHRELRRLVRAELDRHAGLSPWARVLALMYETFSASKWVRGAAALFLAGALLGILWRAAAHRPPGEGQSVSLPAPAAPFAAAPYRDLRGLYRGPDSEGLGGVVPTVDLRYRPPHRLLYFAALRVTGLTAEGRPETGSELVAGPYTGAACTKGCLEIELRVDSRAGTLRLPVATGYVIDPASVHLEGERLAVVAVDDGQPAVRLARARSGRLSYRSAAEVPPGPDSAERDSWPVLPDEIAAFARELADAPADTRAAEAAAFVGARIRYDTSEETAEQYRAARRRTSNVFERALEVGAGDCDVQNAMVAAVLSASGVPSRLAVGWVGIGGRARTALHAWAEYRGTDGRWRVVDASFPGADPHGSAAGAPGLGSGEAATSLGSGFVAPAMAAALATAAIFVLVLGGRWRRSFRAGDSDDILGLLRGGASRPDAFGGVRSLETRHLLRLVDGRSISLATARRLAGRGRLASGSRHSEVARHAARGGGAILDLGQAEARTVADALAAVDLDRWQAVIDVAEEHELASRVAEHLTAGGEHCVIVVADLEEKEVEVHDGSGFGLGGEACRVVLDRSGRLWRSILAIARDHPARARLALADVVLDRTGAPPVARQRCLSALALDAMREAEEGGG